MNKLYHKLRSFSPRQADGFTLVELMVVVAILGILGGATVTLISSIFESNVRSQQRLDQQTQVESLFGFLASRMATARRPVGLDKSSGCSGSQTNCINPLSIAGDQLVFESGGVCYRIFYLKSQKQIRGATANDCGSGTTGGSGANSILPKRGPNEIIADSSANGGNGDNVWQEGETYYDPVLDKAPGDPGGPFILAYNIESDRPNVAPTGYPNPLQIFTYLNEDNKSWPTNDAPNKYACVAGKVPNPNGGSGEVDCEVSAWYNKYSNRGDIMSTDFTAYIATDIQQPAIAPLVYQQNMSFQQVCSDPTASGSGVTAGTVDVRKADYGQEAATPGTISTAYSQVTLATASGSDLQSGPIATQTAWLNYSGMLTVYTPTGGTDGPVQVKVQLFRTPVDDSESVVNDKDGSGEQIFSLAQTSSEKQSIPLQGAFKLPKDGASDNPGDTYKIKVFVKGGSGLKYSRAASELWLNYEVVAW